MPSPRFDLVLFGYRNDLARARVLEHLRRLPAGTTEIAIDAPLPQAVMRGVDHTFGLRRLAELRDLGAQARLMAVDGDEEPLPPPPPAPPPALPPPERARPARLARLPLLLSMLALAVSLYARYAPPRRPLPPSGAPGVGLALAPSGLDPVPHRLNDEAVRLNASGEFAAAADRLRAALERDPQQPALQRNLQVVLHNWAVAELNAERIDSAVGLLEEGLSIGEDAQLLSALGIAQARRGEWAPARVTLERATELGAGDPYTLVALGKVYRQQGEREAAVEMLHRARERGATGPDFDETLGKLERELDAEWDFAQMRSAHFQIAFAEGGRESDAAAQLIARSLEDAYFHVGRQLDHYPSERIPVVLYASEEFHDVTQTPSWTSGVYDGRIKLPVGGINDGDQAVLDRTLRHEYGHVLVHELSRGRCPVWLNEGTAIWSEEERDGDREDWAWRVLAGQPLFRLGDLEGSFTRLPAERVGVAYAQSYLAVRSLVSRGGPRRLRELFAALGSGQPVAEAFRQTFYEEQALFEADLIRSLTEG